MQNNQWLNTCICLCNSACRANNPSTLRIFCPTQHRIWSTEFLIQFSRLFIGATSVRYGWRVPVATSPLSASRRSKPWACKEIVEYSVIGVLQLNPQNRSLCLYFQPQDSLWAELMTCSSAVDRTHFLCPNFIGLPCKYRLALCRPKNGIVLSWTPSVCSSWKFARQEALLAWSSRGTHFGRSVISVQGSVVGKVDIAVIAHCWTEAIGWQYIDIWGNET